MGGFVHFDDIGATFKISRAFIKVNFLNIKVTLIEIFRTHFSIIEGFFKIGRFFEDQTQLLWIKLHFYRSNF